MDIETAKAINSVMKTLTEAIQKVDALYEAVCKDSNEHIQETEDAICENYVTQEEKNAQMEDAICELYEMVIGE